MTAAAAPAIYGAFARKVRPRRPLTVSDWSDDKRKLSTKSSPKPGDWRTANNPPLREIMDCMSLRSAVHEVVAMLPIQFGKSEIGTNVVGYVMDHAPCPIMYALPGEVSQEKWVNQKLNTMVDETPAVQQALVSVASRDSSNTKTFKDFKGGQLYVEHAGSPARLKSTTVKYLIVDEFSEFAAQLRSGDDPVKMLEGRTSAYPSSYKRLYISSPQIAGVCRTEAKWLKSDQRTYHVPCPHCGAMQPLEWSGLMWAPDLKRCWYTCRENGCVIEEGHKTQMIAWGRWVPKYPERKVRGYNINCLYYQLGLGPRWLDLVEMWLEAQNDPAALKTFVNDRLAQVWEDPAMRKVKPNLIQQRAEPYRLRTAIARVLSVTVGVDTQDDRLAVQLVGWGRNMQSWTLDYVELPGDPADDEVWKKLTELLNRPIEHAGGKLIRPDAICIDAAGHRTEAVKNFVRSTKLRRCVAIFGAIPNNAPVLSKLKWADVTWNGKTDKNGVQIAHVGTVAIKHLLYSRIATDAEKEPEKRFVHFSEDLPPEYFTGLVSETYNPAKNRFEKKSGPRNEPLDTWVYAYAATHHPELRLHRRSRADWDAVAARLGVIDTTAVGEAANTETDTDATSVPSEGQSETTQPAQAAAHGRQRTAGRRKGGFATNW